MFINYEDNIQTLFATRKVTKRSIDLPIFKLTCVKSNKLIVWMMDDECNRARKCQDLNF